MTPPELVVLLTDDGTPCGTMPKADVHTTDTPLHLAFSVYVFDGSGRVLMTRRALAKLTWPGVWTNACCGHVAPGEQPIDAARRRLGQELGLTVTALEPALPDFAYRATSAQGIVENEICPVFVATCDDEPRPDPSEVVETVWADWTAVREVAASAPWLLSPWSALQIPLLAARPVLAP